MSTRRVIERREVRDERQARERATGAAIAGATRELRDRLAVAELSLRIERERSAALRDDCRTFIHEFAELRDDAARILVEIGAVPDIPAALALLRIDDLGRRSCGA